MNDDDIKILENLIKHTLEACKCSLDSSSEIESLEKEAQAIENLINRNKELEEENTVLKRANNISEDVKIEDITKFINKSIEDFNKEYIQVAKIKENIELMQESIVNEDYSENTNLVNCSVFDTNIVISYLLELLEEK